MMQGGSTEADKPNLIQRIGNHLNTYRTIYVGTAIPAAFLAYFRFAAPKYHEISMPQEVKLYEEKRAEYRKGISTDGLEGKTSEEIKKYVGFELAKIESLNADMRTLENSGVLAKRDSINAVNAENKAQDTKYGDYYFFLYLATLAGMIGGAVIDTMRLIRKTTANKSYSQSTTEAKQ